MNKCRYKDQSIVHNFLRVALFILLTCTICATFATDRLIIGYKLPQINNNRQSVASLALLHDMATKDARYIATLLNVDADVLGRVGNNAYVIHLKQNKNFKQGELSAMIAAIKQYNPSVSYIEEDRLLHLVQPANSFKLNSLPSTMLTQQSTTINQAKHDKEVPLKSQPAFLAKQEFLSALLVANPRQWDMLASTANSTTLPTNWFGDNLVGAWESVSGATHGAMAPGESIVIAVIDTGYTPHPNFLAHLLPYALTNQEEAGACSSMNGLIGSPCYGYQFISDCRLSGSCAANTSDAASFIPPQPDGLDTGTFVSQSDSQAPIFADNDCLVQNSVWHGSHVIGTILGSGYDAALHPDYITGGASGALLLPLRVLGKCGTGYTSDIVNAIYYAFNGLAGYTNNTQAKVINLSLGGNASSCGAAMQAAINAAHESGVFVVVAAGNSSSDVANTSPANCNYVISVAAKDSTNSLAYYSNYGNVTIAASGGSSNALPDSLIYSTVWSSANQFVPESMGGSPDYAYLAGTSMAAPHVSAAIADILNAIYYINQNVHTIDFAGMVTLLTNNSVALTHSCNAHGCITNNDSLNAGAAVSEAINESSPTPPTPPTPSPSSGGKGGCSSIQGTNDGSLLLVMILLSVVYYSCLIVGRVRTIRKQSNK